MAKRRSTAPARFVVSVFLSAATVGFLTFSTARLSYNMLISEVTTYAEEPGLWLARLFNPAPQVGGMLIAGCSFAFFVVFWFVVLSMIWHTRSGQSRPHT
jgi:hypothetical protein